MATKTTRLIKTIYLYLAVTISLIFVAVGVGRLLNTGLKVAFFPEAEKKSYYECNNQPEVVPIVCKDNISEDQKSQINSLLKDYENWKENQTGDKCIVPVRQNNLVDALTMVIIALPILLTHWRFIKKEKEEKETKIA